MNHPEVIPMSPAFQALWDSPMSQRGTFAYSSDRGTLVQNGVETGKLTILGVRRIEGVGTIVTMHEKGSSYWAARGSRGYSGAEIRTLLVERRTDRSFRFILLSAVQAATNDAERDLTTARGIARLEEVV